MNLLEKNSDFVLFESYFQEVLIKGKQLPNQIFKERFDEYAFIPFDDLFGETLFNIVNHQRNEEVYWAVLNPCPSSYYFKHFGKYNIVKWAAGEENFGGFWEAINKAPADSPADSLIDNSYSICMFSTVGNWCVYGDRDTDIAICAFNTGRDKSDFIEGYDEYLISRENELIQYIESLDDKEIQLFRDNYLKGKIQK